MENWQIIYTNQAIKDLENLKAAGLFNKAKNILYSLALNPFDLNIKKLRADLIGFYSVRINLQHRIVFEINIKNKTIKIISAYKHYK